MWARGKATLAKRRRKLPLPLASLLLNPRGPPRAGAAPSSELRDGGDPPPPEGLCKAGERQEALCPPNRSVALAKSDEERRKKAKTWALVSKIFPQTAIPPTPVAPTAEKWKMSSCSPPNPGLPCTAAGPELAFFSAIKYLRSGSKFGTVVSKPGGEV